MAANPNHGPVPPTANPPNPPAAAAAAADGAAVPPPVANFANQNPPGALLIEYAPGMPNNFGAAYDAETNSFIGGVPVLFNGQLEQYAADGVTVVNVQGNPQTNPVGGFQWRTHRHLAQTNSQLRQATNISAAASLGFGCFRASTEATFCETNQTDSRTEYFVSQTEVIRADIHAVGPRIRADVVREMTRVQNAAAFFRQRFGTHYVAGIQTGGKMTYIAKMTHQTSVQHSHNQMGVQVAVQALFAGASAAVSAAFQNLQANHQVQMSFSLNFLGPPIPVAPGAIPHFANVQACLNFTEVTFPTLVQGMPAAVGTGFRVLLLPYTTIPGASFQLLPPAVPTIQNQNFSTLADARAELLAVRRPVDSFANGGARGASLQAALDLRDRVDVLLRVISEFAAANSVRGWTRDDLVAAGHLVEHATSKNPFGNLLHAPQLLQALENIMQPSAARTAVALTWNPFVLDSTSEWEADTTFPPQWSADPDSGCIYLRGSFVVKASIGAAGITWPPGRGYSANITQTPPEWAALVGAIPWTIHPVIALHGAQGANCEIATLSISDQSLALAYQRTARNVCVFQGGSRIRLDGIVIRAACQRATSVPVGAVMAFALDAVPDGWLKCDGSPIPPGLIYDQLRRLLGANPRFVAGGVVHVPDMKGRVAMGPEYEVDPGQIHWREVGCLPGDTVIRTDHYTIPQRSFAQASDVNSTFVYTLKGANPYSLQPSITLQYCIKY